MADAADRRRLRADRAGIDRADRSCCVVALRNALLPEGEVALNARQRQALAEAAQRRWTRPAPAIRLIAAEALRLARAALDRITGRAGVEDMLDALFGRFCIGK